MNSEGGTFRCRECENVCHTAPLTDANGSREVEGHYCTTRSCSLYG